MKYEKDSVAERILGNFPIRYVVLLLILWILVVGGLVYLGVVI